jgi:hypothetical protein
MLALARDENRIWRSTTRALPFGRDESTTEASLRLGMANAQSILDLYCLATLPVKRVTLMTLAVSIGCRVDGCSCLSPSGVISVSPYNRSLTDVRPAVSPEISSM